MKITQAHLQFIGQKQYPNLSKKLKVPLVSIHNLIPKDSRPYSPNRECEVRNTLQLLKAWKDMQAYTRGIKAFRDALQFHKVNSHKELIGRFVVCLVDEDNEVVLETDLKADFKSGLTIKTCLKAENDFE